MEGSEMTDQEDEFANWSRSRAETLRTAQEVAKAVPARDRAVILSALMQAEEDSRSILKFSRDR